MKPLPEDEGTDGVLGGAPSSMTEPLPPSVEAPRNQIVPHDCFRQVYLGQLSDPLFPAHPEPPEAEEDELTRAALEDSDALSPDPDSTAPTFWRFLAIVFFAVVALGVVFLIK